MGIGMAVVVPAGSEERAVDAVRAVGTEASIIGLIVEEPGVRLR